MSFVAVRHGKFWNESRKQAWFPVGVAYQLWIRDTGVWQTRDQIEYDLDQMQALHANSLRIDFTWRSIETEYWDYAALPPEHWDKVFEKYDEFIRAAKKRNFKLFAIIGYQWPPLWFPDEAWTGYQPDNEHAAPWKGKTISFENPEARRLIARYLQMLAARYRDEECIAAWILGNEHSYLDMIELHQKGYDPASVLAFRKWLEAKYAEVGRLNQIWGSHWPDFSAIEMPFLFDHQQNLYPKQNPAIHDLLQWREDSLADFVAFTARVVRQTDPHHLLSYSGIGMIWGEEDYRYLGEDAGKIAAACRQSGAPLDFWSINNYCYKKSGDENAAGKMGYVKARHDTGLPVLCSETGFSSTENFFDPITLEEQGLLLKSTILEAVMCGAVGIHVFTLQDRPFNLVREKGFGILYSDRKMKPAYKIIQDVFRQIRKLEPEMASLKTVPEAGDVAFVWTDATDVIHNRYRVEMSQLFGSLERLGYCPGFINLEELRRGDYARYRVLVLPRNERMSQEEFDLVFNRARSAGVAIHANAEVPGIRDEYGRVQPARFSTLEKIFGIEIASLKSYETSSRTVEHRPITLSITPAYQSRLGKKTEKLKVWNYSGDLSFRAGNPVAFYAGGKKIAVNFHPAATGVAAINTFSLGDQGFEQVAFSKRRDWCRLIYEDCFGLRPCRHLRTQGLVSFQLGRIRVGECLAFIKNMDDRTRHGRLGCAEFGDLKPAENLLDGGGFQTRKNKISFALGPLESTWIKVGRPVSRKKDNASAPAIEPAPLVRAAIMKTLPNPRMRIHWERLPEYWLGDMTTLRREEIFPSRVAVYKSLKTQKKDPTHFQQVESCCRILQKLGYAESRLGIYEEAKGYYILDDDMRGLYGEKLDLNYHFLKEFYPVLILPGVSVMNEGEYQNLKSYLKHSTYAVIVAGGAAGVFSEKTGRRPGSESKMKYEFKPERMQALLGKGVLSRQNYDQPLHEEVKQEIRKNYWPDLSWTGKKILATQEAQPGKEIPVVIGHRLTDKGKKQGKAVVVNSCLSAATPGNVRLWEDILDWTHKSLYRLQVEMGHGRSKSLRFEKWLSTECGKTVFELPWKIKDRDEYWVAMELYTLKDSRKPKIVYTSSIAPQPEARGNTRKKIANGDGKPKAFAGRRTK